MGNRENPPLLNVDNAGHEPCEPAIADFWPTRGLAGCSPEPLGCSPNPAGLHSCLSRGPSEALVITPMSTGRKRKVDSVTKATRAPLACERCRVKKLRCSGGDPCRSCLNAGAPCDFDVSPGRSDRLGGVDLTVRVGQLEKMVTELQQQVQTLACREGGPRTHPPRVEQAPTQMTPSTISPRTAQRSDETSASRFLAVTLPAHSAVAPFPAFMHHPSIWENRSRSPSPDTVPLGRTEYVAKAGLRDDPVSTGLVNEDAATALYQL